MSCFNQRIKLFLKKNKRMDLQDLITSLRLIKKEKAEIIWKENQLKKPVIEKLNHVQSVYSEFCNVKQRFDTYNRKLFIFICLVFFSPATILYEPLKVGLRPTLSKVLGCKSVAIISKDYTEAIELYFNNQTFHDEVSAMLKYLTPKLQEKNIIKGELCYHL